MITIDRIKLHIAISAYSKVTHVRVVNRGEVQGSSFQGVLYQAYSLVIVRKLPMASPLLYEHHKVMIVM